MRPTSPSSLRARLLTAALALTALASGAPAAASAADFSTDVALTCGRPGYTTGTAPENDVVLTVSGSVEDSAQPGDPVQLLGVSVKLRVNDGRSPQPPAPFIWGNVEDLELSLGANTAETIHLGGGSFGKIPHDDLGYGPAPIRLFGSATPPPVTMPSHNLTLRVATFRYGYFGASDATTTSPPVVPNGTVCRPAAGQPALAHVISRLPTGLQYVDASVPMTCFSGSSPAEDVIVGITGSLPYVTGGGDPVSLARLDVTLRKIDGSIPAAPYIWGNVSALTLSAENATTSTIVAGSGPIPLTAHAPNIRVRADDYGLIPIVPYAGTPAPTVTAAETGKLVLRIKSLDYGFTTAQNASDPVLPFIPGGIKCVPGLGELPIASIVANVSANSPVVSRVYGNAWANIGGLIRVHGSKLAGAKYVTFGTKKVRPLLVVGSSDVWVLAPPLPKGTYPVAVGTATTVSPPGTGSSTTIAYR